MTQVSKKKVFELDISINDKRVNDVLITVTSSTKWCKVFDAYAGYCKINKDSLKFCHDGQRIVPAVTPTICDVL